MAETMTDRDIQYRFRKMSQEISNLKRKAGVARERQIVAEARSHDMKIRAKSAEHGLRGLLQRCERNEQALARRDALLRRWIERRKHLGGLLQDDLLEDTERELGDSHD